MNSYGLIGGTFGNGLKQDIVIRGIKGCTLGQVGYQFFAIGMMFNFSFFGYSLGLASVYLSFEYGVFTSFIQGFGSIGLYLSFCGNGSYFGVQELSVYGGVLLGS